ncbi:hypothetical protein H072_943 [Dactylellina haptotyla CBS 200.50]|uniref:Uncharacterized protein n=1 Tax=Dactylellina haptotyla (strain CBS 200.50) TaxID=1284197 RepID=S8BZX3_DACHA|nr:hypothetical protein H072_943 [Dactylellina haptotyla CBS 200.50]
MKSPVFNGISAESVLVPESLKEISSYDSSYGAGTSSSRKRYDFSLRRWLAEGTPDHDDYVAHIPRYLASGDGVPPWSLVYARIPAAPFTAPPIQKPQPQVDISAPNPSSFFSISRDHAASPLIPIISDRESRFTAARPIKRLPKRSRRQSRDDSASVEIEDSAVSKPNADETRISRDFESTGISGLIPEVQDEDIEGLRLEAERIQLLNLQESTERATEPSVAELGLNWSRGPDFGLNSFESTPPVAHCQEKPVDGSNNNNSAHINQGAVATGHTATPSQPNGQISRTNHRLPGNRPEDEGNEGLRPNRRNGRRDLTGPEKQLACPFAKGQPGTYWRCLHIGRQNLSGVKEHLKRNHFQRILPPDIRSAKTWNEVFDCCNPNWSPKRIPDPYVDSGNPLEVSPNPTRTTAPINSTSLPQPAQSHPIQSPRSPPALCSPASPFIEIGPQPATTTNINATNDPGAAAPLSETKTNEFFDLGQGDTSHSIKDPKNGIDASTIWQSEILNNNDPGIGISHDPGLGPLPSDNMDVFCLDGLLEPSADVDHFQDQFTLSRSPPSSDVYHSILSEMGLRDTGFQAPNLNFNPNPPPSPPPPPPSWMPSTSMAPPPPPPPLSLPLYSTPQSTIPYNFALPPNVTFADMLPSRISSQTPLSNSTASRSRQSKSSVSSFSSLGLRSKRYSLIIARQKEVNTSEELGPKRYTFDSFEEFRRDFTIWMTSVFTDPQFTWGTMELVNEKREAHISSIEAVINELEFWFALNQTTVAAFLLVTKEENGKQGVE